MALTQEELNQRLTEVLKRSTKERLNALDLLTVMIGGNDQMTGNLEVERTTTSRKIILPKNMSLQQGIDWLQRKQLEEETVVGVSKEMPAFPLDGARAFMLALKDIYGWTELQGQWGMQGWEPPRFFQIEVGYKLFEDIPWGKVRIPGIDGYLITTTAIKQGQYFFSMGGEVRRKHLGAIEKIAEKTREYINSNSIYRGQALRLEFDEEHGFSGNTKITRPQFIEPTKLTKDDLVLPLVAEKEVNAGIFTMIEHYKAARELGVPCKRANLLVGPFGVGKTMAATIASRLCIENGRTFIYVANVRKLVEAIAFARQYAPAMIFAEDIDTVMRGEDRTEEISEILNTIDGVDTKQSDILFVLTSNSPELITEAFLRTGRSDMVIYLGPPDKHAAARLLRIYGGEVLAASTGDLLEVGAILAESQMIPSAIREVVERSKLFALAESKGDPNVRIHKDDLLFASNGVRRQIEMLRKPKGAKLPDGYTNLGSLVLGPQQRVDDLGYGIAKNRDDIYQELG